MPELPEVQTTVSILNKLIKGLAIRDVWTDYDSLFHKDKENIKNKNYFPIFKKAVVGKKIENVSRRGKNVLINLSGRKTILTHMKMTGHFLYGTYKRDTNPRIRTNNTNWIPAENGMLTDPMNRFVHLVFTLSNGKHLALSDMRKFAKVMLIETKNQNKSEDLKDLGQDALDEKLSSQDFEHRLNTKTKGKIKTVLMDQSVIAGIGNIYSDEILWASKIHPERKVNSLSEKETHEIHKNMGIILKKGIRLGGDSMSDYRNPYGEKGNFQNKHCVYRRTGKPCLRKNCAGKINRKIIGSRSAHFCPKCQK